MYIHERHDIGITRTDGTKVGLMLARDREAPIYKTYQDKYLVQQRATTPDYGALDPENEIRMIGIDWRSGFGQEYFSVKDPFRYYSSRGMDGRFKGMFIPGPTPTAISLNTNTGYGAIPPYCHVSFASNEYIGRGKLLERLSPAGDVFVLVNTMVHNISCLEKFSDNQLYIALGTTNGSWEMTTLETFTKCNLNIKSFDLMKTVHTTVDTMYANNSNNDVWSTAAPKSGGTNWANKVTVGALDDAITGLLSHDAEIHIMKEDKPYYISSGGNAHSNTAPILETLKSTTSGKNAIEYLGKLYIPAGQQALLEVGDYKTWRTPAEYMTNLPEFVGRVQALAHDDQWLYALLANTGYGVEVLAGREEDVEGSVGWVWHPIAEVPIANCETAWVSSIYQKRLWVTSTDGGESIYYIPLYSGYGDVLNDVNAKFKTNTWMTTPYLHGGFRGDNKGFPELELTLGHAYNADVFIQAHYQKLGDTTWTAIANYSGNATHPLQTNYLPDAGTVHPVSTMMQLKLTSHTSHTDKAPQLASYDLKGWLYPKVRNIIECEVRCADGILDKHGHQLEEASAKYIRDTIEEAQDATWPFTFYDLWGDSHTVRVLPTPTFSYALAHQKDENPEERFILRLQEVTTA